MGLTELIFLALAVSMDAFAVAVCKGLCTRKADLRQMVIVGLWFGGFQALMPTLGYFLGIAFESYIVAFDHWIAFILLGLIGANMIRESFSKEDEVCDVDSTSYSVRAMFPLAIATSIDALAIGITFAVLKEPMNQMFMSVGLIGAVTFILSAIGVKVGNVFGLKYKAKAELFGGIVLVLLGTKILLEHLNILHF